VVGVLTFFPFPAGGVPEAVAAHPPCKLAPFNGRIVARDGAWLPAPVLIARVLRLAVTQLENWTHALVASLFKSGTMRAPGRRKNHGSDAAACVAGRRSRLAADAGAIDRGVR
jgi:hypothetical protein